ncbi:MAG: hypothetical protein FJ098_16320, partial [Deltaproteobacteria bacterium]|nr:hypothetical protein [Deltaproteobacteria bacterium]
MTLSERLAAAWICALLSCAPWGRLAASPGEPATSPPLLPAWETPEERAAAAKADEHDDY